MKLDILQQARLFAMAIGIIISTFLSGCASTGSKQLAVIQENGPFYKAYLNGDVNQARQNLAQMIQLYQSPKAEILGPSAQAGYLFGCYARLFVLESRVGNKDDAEAALTKARYFHLESYDKSDDGWRTRVTLNEFLRYQTPEQITRIVDRLDKGSNGGNEPKYIQYLRHE
jgi:hypothetical protein